MIRHYENRKAGHNKFYDFEGPLPRISRGERLFVIDTWHGKIGTEGQWIVYPYPSKEAALSGLQAIHEERIKHGYIELGKGETWEQKMKLEPDQLKLF